MELLLLMDVGGVGRVDKQKHKRDSEWDKQKSSHIVKDIIRLDML